MVWNFINQNPNIVKDLKIAVENGQIEAVHKYLSSLQSNPMKNPNAIELLNFIGIKQEDSVKIIYRKLVDSKLDYQLDEQLAYNICVGNAEIVDFLLSRDIHITSILLKKMKVSERLFTLPCSPARQIILSNLRNHQFFKRKEIVEDFFIKFLNNVQSTDGDAVEIAKIFVELVVSANNVINCFDDLSKTSAIHFAVKQKNSKLIKYFIELGADSNKINFFGEIPLHLAILNCNIDILELFVDRKAEIHVKDSMNRTALHTACSDNFYDCIKLLINHGADLCSTDDFDNTPLSSLKNFLPNLEKCQNSTIKKLSVIVLNDFILNSDSIIIENSEIANNHFKACTTELRQISSTKFFNSYSYLYILCINKKLKKLAYLSKNEEFVKNFYENLSLFGIYKSDLESNSEKIEKCMDTIIEIEKKEPMISDTNFIYLFLFYQ